MFIKTLRGSDPVSCGRDVVSRETCTSTVGLVPIIGDDLIMVLCVKREATGVAVFAWSVRICLPGIGPFLVFASSGARQARSC